MKLSKLILSILALVITETTRAQDVVLQSWLKAQSNVNSLDANFIQERKLPSLKHAVTTPGHLTFEKPGKVRWQLGEPPATLVISDGKQLTMVDVTEKRARQMAADSAQGARFSLLSGAAFQSKEAFAAAFDVIESRISDGIHQYTLQPKDRRMRNNLPWIFIDIDPAKNELRALEIELSDKSRVRTVFQNPKINTRPPANLFIPDLTGYKVW